MFPIYPSLRAECRRRFSPEKLLNKGTLDAHQSFSCQTIFLARDPVDPIRLEVSSFELRWLLLTQSGCCKAEKDVGPSKPLPDTLIPPCATKTVDSVAQASPKANQHFLRHSKKYRNYKGE